MKRSIEKAVSLVQFYGIRVVPVVWREMVFQLARLLPGVDTVEARPWDYRLRVPVKVDGIGRALYVLRLREADHQWMLQRIVTPGDTILDIGANIGYYALMEARLLQGRGRIIAIEPDARNLVWLRENVRRAGFDNIIEVIEGGVSNREGELLLVQADRTNLSRIARDGEAADESRPVQVRELAAILRSRERVNVIRMDVEGHEIEVLESALTLVQSNPDKAPHYIIFETHEYGSRAPRMREIMTQMLQLGYRVRYLASDDEHRRGGSVISARGLRPVHVLYEWGVTRGVYENVEADTAADLIAGWKGTRTVCLEFVTA